MKKIMFAIAGIMLALLPLGAQDIDSYYPGAGEGIAFFLPKTALEVNIIATKVEYTPGEYCQYANRYMRLNNIKGEAETHWEIKEINVKSVGVPDSTKAYIVKLKDREVLSNITLTSDGIIWAINDTPEATDDDDDYELEKPQKHENPRNYMTEEILSAGSTAKMAELTAKDIYNIRESKNLILRGQAETLPKDGASLKLIIDNLDKQEKVMMQLFSGIEDRTDKLFTFRISPDENLKNAVVARFSIHNGVVDKDDLSGTPIYISVTSTSPLANAIDEYYRRPTNGVMFNMPGKGRVKVTYNGESQFDKELPVTQFGTYELLSSKIFTLKSNARVIFNPATGQIVKIDKDM